MPRKKKLDTESQQAVGAANEEKIGAVSELEAEEKILEKYPEKAKPEVKITEINAEDLSEKKKVKKEVKKLSETELKRVMTDTKETLVPLTDYIACSVHLGTKVITPEMRKFVYKRRADGLAVLNTNLIDDKIREAVKFLNSFAPEDIFVVCKREAGWPAVEKFAEVTGIRKFTKKYPAGIITNLQLETFFEAKLAIICDPWVDKNALNDAQIVGLPVLAICDTNNYTAGVKQLIPANNKSRKSVGIILFILAREYLKSLGKDKEAKALKMEDFTGKIETAVEVEEAKKERKSRMYEARAESVDVAEKVSEGV